MYKAAARHNEKDLFIAQWKDLENICDKIFQPQTGVPTDEIFTRYMYYERAKNGIKDYTIGALRKFYEDEGYKLLTENYDITFGNLMSLANFWLNVHERNESMFSPRVLKRLFVLSHAPNGMWTYITSVYFMTNKGNDDTLDEEKFYIFLNKITAFIWAYTVMKPGVTSLRGPLVNEMVNIVDKKDAAFSGYRFDPKNLRNMLENSVFTGHRPITRAILVWWAFSNPKQELLPIGTKLEVEHIYAKNRTPSISNIEAIGNKSILEKNINIRASDYRFEDKVRYYLGLVSGRRGTKICELLEMAHSKKDFYENDVQERTKAIIDAFMNFVAENNLLR